MNNLFTKRTPIPWDHQSSDVFASWNWRTPHFSATIIAEGLQAKKMYSWKILDKSSGFPKPFDNGVEMSFKEATDVICETIAKAYPQKLGYQQYAGNLAYTFQISDGQKYDFSPAIGETVILVVREDDGSETIFTGLFDIVNYDFSITVGEISRLIPPLRVIDVKREFGMTSYIKSSNPNSAGRSKTNRIVYEEWTKGCTGKPGYRPGTTIHPPTAPYCSKHGV